MSEEQLSALLAKLRQDSGLREKLKGAANFDDAMALIQSAGFNVSKADIMRHDAAQILSLSDGELEAVAGGVMTDPRGGDSQCIPVCHDWFVSEYIPCNTGRGPMGTCG